MNITDECISLIFGDSPFIASRTADKQYYEVVQQTNADWREVIGLNEDFSHRGFFQSYEEAKIHQRRLHVRWALSPNAKDMGGEDQTLNK